MDYNLSPTALFEYARLYKEWYIAAICAFSAIVILTQNKTNQKFNNIFSLIVGIVIIGFITFRPPVGTFFGDTGNYIRSFEAIADRDYNLDSKDLGHETLMYGLQSFSYIALFFIYALIYVGCQLLAVKRLFPQYCAVAFIILVTSFSFFGYGFNGMRNGAACALVMLAFTERKLIYQLLLFVIACSFHLAVIIPIIVFYIIKVYKKSSFYITLWLICVIFNFIFKDFLGDLAWLTEQFDDDRTKYLNSTFEDVDITFSNTGFRWDFVIYSSVPIILGFYSLFKLGITHKRYIDFLNTYILTNSLWLFTIWIPYTNRFAYLSWFLYPIVLFYPFIIIKNFRTNASINLLIILNLVFTLVT